MLPIGIGRNFHVCCSVYFKPVQCSGVTSCNGRARTSRTKGNIASKLYRRIRIPVDMNTHYTLRLPAKGYRYCKSFDEVVRWAHSAASFGNAGWSLKQPLCRLGQTRNSECTDLPTGLYPVTRRGIRVHALHSILVCTTATWHLAACVAQRTGVYHRATVEEANERRYRTA